MSRTVSIDDVRKYPDLPWDRRYLSCNRSLSMHDILDLPLKEGEWDWYWISMDIPINDVYKYPNIKWSRDALSYNNNIKIDDLLAWKEISL